MTQGPLDLGSTNFEIAEQIAEVIDRTAYDPKDHRAVTAAVVHTLLDHPQVDAGLRDNLVRDVASVLKVAVTIQEAEVIDDG